MRTFTLSAMALSLALVACGGGDTGQDDTAATGDQPMTETPAPTASGTPPEGATAEDVAAGQQIFTSVGNCNTSHGPDGTGTALAPNLTDAEWINIDGTFASIQENVRTGVPQPKQHPAPMPAMGGANLNDDQIRQVSAYVWSLGGGK